MRSGSRLAWPRGTPAPYRQLADACMAEAPGDRPPFAGIEAALQVRNWNLVHDQPEKP